MTITAQHTANREIRVFISSTFRDMHAERDYLISHVFPVIRRACRERQVEFTEIDLRWGVTKEEAEQGKVVRICLEEINRCRPYFLSLLGDRYGWAPIEADLDHKAELLALFPFLEDSLKAGLSVTEMEILHGVLDNPDMAEHSFFYLRDKALSQSLAESYNTPHDYFETEQRLNDKLTALKDKVRSSGLPVRDNYASIEALAELIKQDLLAVLDTQFPEDQTPTPLEAEQNAHRSYARERCQAYIANPKDIEILDKHLNTLTNHALLITGESGLGKSALLAYWLNQQRLIKPEQFIIEHYVGISGDADPVAIIRRIMAEIKNRNHDSEDLPSKPEQIIRDFPLWLAKISERDPLLLIIDGFNQLENKEGLWLPSFWQENVKAIFSVIPCEQLEALSQRTWPVHTLEALDIKRREQLIREWLASYRKALTAEQTQLIAQAPQTGNPLFLKTVLEELRIFGYFEQLDQRISTLLSANNPQELFILVLARLENDFGKDIVTQIMQALWAARRGLSETEIAGITGLSRLTISTFLMAIDAHLAKRGGLLNFFHDYLRQAVKLHGLENKENETHAHIKLAQYFEQQELNNRVAEELPWQWQQAERWVALKDCISAIPMFEVLYEKDDLELLAYWLVMGDRFDAGECYTKSLNTWENNNKPEQSQLANILDSLANFLGLTFAYYKIAVRIIRRSLLIKKQFNNQPSNNLAISLSILGVLLVRLRHNEDAANVLKNAVEISQKNLSEKNPLTAKLLHNYAYTLFILGNYDESMKIHSTSHKIIESSFGENHTETADSLDSLAECYRYQSFFKEALLLHNKALMINRTVRGSNHPKTATSLNNLALTLEAEGSLNDAEILYRQSIEIYKNTLGKNHPNTANTSNNLAVLLFHQGKYEEASILYKKSLACRIKVLGLNHPDTATSFNNLGKLYEKQGYYKKSEKSYCKAISIYKKTIGLSQKDTLNCLNNLASLYFTLGEYAKSILLYKKCIVSNDLIFGKKSNNCMEYYYCLARCSWEIDKLDDAELYFRRELEILKQIHGDILHESTLESMQQLGVFLREQQKYKEAESLLRDVVKNREFTSNLDDTELAGSLNALGLLLVNTNRIEEAIPLYTRALDIREKALGADHPQTVLIRERLTEVTNK